jgi:hypothetical protein
MHGCSSPDLDRTLCVFVCNRINPLASAEAGSTLSLLLGEWLGKKPAHPKPPAPAPSPAPKTPVKCGTAPENTVQKRHFCAIYI